MDRKHRSFRRIQRFGAILSLFLSLGIIFVATQVSSVAVPLSILRLGSGTILLAGIIMGAISLLLTVFPSRMAVSLMMFQLVTVVAFSLSSRERRKGDLEVDPIGKQRTWLNAVDWHETYTQPDEELGFRGLANSQPRVHHRDFDVAYRLGPDGYRVMPVPQETELAPIIVFLGCSMTFGAGCANEEIYPWLLAEKAWPSYRVMNWSVSGWGTMHAAINLDRALKLKPKPRLVLYGFIGDHIKRNDRRDTWHKQNDYLVFNEQGEFESLAQDGQGTVPDSPELRAKEIRLTRAILSRMKDKCDREGVPFAVLYLDDKDPFGPGRCEQVLDVPGMNVIDLRQSFTEVYPNDFHLTPLGHQVLARAIARDETLANLSGLADLYQPTAFPDVFPHERDFRPALVTDEFPEKHRRVEYQSTEDSLKVQMIESFGAADREISFARELPPIKQGQYAMVTLRAASPMDRNLSLLLDHWSLTSLPIGKVYPFVTNRGVVRRFFLADQDIEHPRMRIWCGGDETPFEIQEFSAEISDRLRVGFDWLEVFETGTQARFDVQTGADGERIVRVDELRMISPANWKIQYQVAGVPVVAGGKYRVSFRVKSDQPKEIPLVLQSDSSSGQIISGFEGIKAMPEWSTHEFTFETTAEAPIGIICFTLGQDTTPVEFQNVVMEKIQPASE